MEGGQRGEVGIPGMYSMTFPRLWECLEEGAIVTDPRFPFSSAVQLSTSRQLQ